MYVDVVGFCYRVYLFDTIELKRDDYSAYWETTDKPYLLDAEKYSKVTFPASRGKISAKKMFFLDYMNIGRHEYSINKFRIVYYHLFSITFLHLCYMLVVICDYPKKLY